MSSLDIHLDQVGVIFLLTIMTLTGAM